MTSTWRFSDCPPKTDLTCAFEQCDVPIVFRETTLAKPGTAHGIVLGEFMSFFELPPKVARQLLLRQAHCYF
jgi:hypothetical protein